MGLEAPREPGMRATFAGQALGPPGAASGVAAAGGSGRAGGAAAQDRFQGPSERFGAGSAEDRVRPPSPAPRDLVTRSGFTLSGERGGGLGTLWGRGAYTGFRGSADALALDGGVTTGMVGADYANGGWVVGLPLSLSLGDGRWRSPDLGVMARLALR